MKALICFVLFLAAGALASAQTTTPKKITDYPDLGAPIDSTDWLLMHDTSANAYKRIGPANLLASKQDTSGNLTSLASLVDPNGNRMLIWNDATNEFDYQTIPAGGSLSLTGRRIPYGDNAGGSTHEAGFEYDPTNDLFKVGYGVEIGGGVDGLMFYKSGASELTLTDNGNGNELVFDLSVEDEMRIGASSVGFDRIFFDGIDVEVPADAYGAGWATSAEVPRKMDVYAKIESLAPSGGDVTAAAAFANDNRLVRSDGTGKGVQASGIIIDDSNNVSGVGSFSASSASFTNATFTNLNVDTVDFEDSDASHRTSLEFGSNLTAHRSFNVITGDTDRILTLQGDPTLGDWFNQSVKTTASPTFANVTVDAETYGAGWSGDPTVARKADIYTKIETMGGGGSGASIATFRQNVFMWDDLLMNGNYNTTYNAVGPFGLKGTLSAGASASQQQSVLTTAFGMVRLDTGSTGTPAAGLGSAGTSILFNATQAASYNAETRIITGSSITNCEIRALFIDSFTSTEPTDGVYFRYSAADASWVCVCRSNGTETTADSAIDVAVSTGYVLRATVNATGSSATFYINGSSVGTITTNIPGGSTSRVTGIGWSIYSSEAVTKQMDIDYMGLEVSYSSAR